MKEIGAALLVRTVAGLAAGTLKEIPQSAADDSANNSANDPANSSTADSAKRPAADPAHGPVLRPAPKIFTETCRIDWNRPVADIYNLIRGLSPFPGAFTDLDGKICKVFASEKENRAPAIAPGRYDTDQRTYLRFAAADGYIRVTELQLEGKKRMKIEDFLRGFRPNT